MEGNKRNGSAGKGFAELNKHDRKVLDRYKNSYSSFMEMNTAEDRTAGDERQKGKS